MAENLSKKPEISLIHPSADKTETKVSQALKLSADKLINMWFVENSTKCGEVTGLLCWYNVKCTC